MTFFLLFTDNIYRGREQQNLPSYVLSKIAVALSQNIGQIMNIEKLLQHEALQNASPEWLTEFIKKLTKEK